MRSFKKWTAVLLAAVLTFSGVAACNNNDDSDKTEKPPKTEAPQDPDKEKDDGTETEASKDDETPETEDKDDNGSKDDDGDYYPMHILGTEGHTGNFRFSDRERYHIWDEFLDLFHSYGLDPEFEIVAMDQYQTTIQTRMATATDLPEFAKFSELGDTEIFKMADRGLILPLNDMIEEHSDGTAKAFFGPGGLGERSWNLNTREDGKVYFISQIQSTTYDGKPGSTNIVVCVREDWLEELDMDVPETAEAFKEMLIAFQENDMNGNGEKDEIVSIDFANFGGHISEWFGLVYGISNFMIDDGKPSDFTSPWHQEGLRPYFEYMKSLNDEGLLDPSVIGSTSQNQNIENNMASAISTYTMASWNEPSVVGAENPRYLPIAALDAVDGIEPVLAIEPPDMSFGRWGFTREATNMEANAALLDVLTSERYMELTQWGIKGETYEVGEDGENKLLPIAFNDAYEEGYEKGIVIGDTLWANGHMFPKRRFLTRENEMTQVPEYKAEQQVKFFGYTHNTPMGIDNYLPVESIEESERLQQFSNDLYTRSSELATQIILGAESLDNLDAFVEELDSLGLAEMIEIHQGRLDRAIEMGIFD